ncbi:hypothetical protein AB9F45_38420, partial [Rhizobium leguminosarum]
MDRIDIRIDVPAVSA